MNNTTNQVPVPNQIPTSKFPSSPMIQDKKNKTRLLTILLFFLLVISLAVAGFFIYQNFKPKKEVQRNSPNPVVSDKLTELHLRGGIAGFCDDLIIYSDKNASYSNECNNKQSNFQVKPEDFNQLMNFVDELGQYSYDNEDNPAGPDSLFTQLILYGKGPSSKQPDSKQKDSLFKLLNTILMNNKLSKY